VPRPGTAKRRVDEEPTRDATPVLQSDVDRPVELVLGFARAGHEAGYPTADLEERLLVLARAVGQADAQISATPTLVEVSLGSIPEQRSYTIRVRPRAVDLDAIARLDELVQDVVDGRLDAERALAALADIREQPLERPWPLVLAAYALAGAALTPVLGGGWREVLAGGLVGLVVGGVALPAQWTARLEPMVAPLAAVAASFCAAALAQIDVSDAPDLVTLAALVTFLPGMRLTIGMRELATEHLQSGVANTASALVQLLGLVFGVGIGRSIAAAWFGTTQEIEPEAAFTAPYIVAALATGVAFTLTLRARYRDALLMCVATVLALVANEAGTEIFGREAAVFVAALTVGVVGGLVGSRLRRSPLVFIVPGVLMLVPGSAGFNSALQLLSNQTVSGISAAFDTFVTAMSIAYGLIVSASLFPGRSAPPSRGDDLRAS
jgi:uncharacterized membrane protein YjjP (DUF1212 family)